MFCLPKACHSEKSALKDLSATVMLLGGILGIVYFGWKLAEKLRPLCEKKHRCTCCCDDDASEHNGYDHFSEGDCLSHDAKDYYGRCGCFDDDGGTDGEDGSSDL